MRWNFERVRGLRQLSGRRSARNIDGPLRACQFLFPNRADSLHAKRRALMTLRAFVKILIAESPPPVVTSHAGLRAPAAEVLQRPGRGNL